MIYLNYATYITIESINIDAVPSFLSFNILAYSELPAFLVQEGGLNSGFMLAHCTAAALGMIYIPKMEFYIKIQPFKNPNYKNFWFIVVSENKTLCHPASVDSLSTSAGTEDHVSMGGFAARKALQVVRNVEKVTHIKYVDLIHNKLKPLVSK